MIARQTPQQRRGQGNFLDVDPQVVDFGTIFISHASVRTVEIRSSRLRDVSVCSQLVGVVYFKDNQQQIDLADCIALAGAMPAASASSFQSAVDVLVPCPNYDTQLDVHMPHSFLWWPTSSYVWQLGCLSQFWVR